MTKHKNGSLEKSIRLIVLMRWQDNGELIDLSLQDIANKFIKPPNRSSILRDLRDVKRLRKLLHSS